MFLGMHLGRHVVEGAYAGPGPLCCQVQRSAKVGQAHIPAGSEQNILWLDVPVQDALHRKGLEPVNGTRDVMTCEQQWAMHTDDRDSGACMADVGP